MNELLKFLDEREEFWSKNKPSDKFEKYVIDHILYELQIIKNEIKEQIGKNK